MSVFSSIELAPRDPILGLNEAFHNDTRPNKINLSAGVFLNEEGKVPLLNVVAEAEKARLAAHAAHSYLPMQGLPAYDAAVQRLLFGADSPVIAEGRALTVQSLGGTGALKLGADFIKRFFGDTRVVISNPSWANHRAIFETAGLKVERYRYYDAATNSVDVKGMLEDLQALPEGSVVLLHACCHNPTGVDLSAENWSRVVDTIAGQRLVPFLDIAYQGFGDGLVEDALALRLFSDSGLEFFVASSFSKSFSLYGERIGALTVVANQQSVIEPVLSQFKRLIRTNYSNPPTHGAVVVSSVLNSTELYGQWQQELTAMRAHIQQMRTALAQELPRLGAARDFSFVTQQRGLFSYTGFSKEQITRLRDEFAVYAINSGRINIAGLNRNNVEQVAQAIFKVL